MLLKTCATLVKVARLEISGLVDQIAVCHQCHLPFTGSYRSARVRCGRMAGD